MVNRTDAVQPSNGFMFTTSHALHHQSTCACCQLTAVAENSAAAPVQISCPCVEWNDLLSVVCQCRGQGICVDRKPDSKQRFCSVAVVLSCEIHKNDSPALFCHVQAGSWGNLAGRCHPCTAQMTAQRRTPGTSAIPI